LICVLIILKQPGISIFRRGCFFPDGTMRIQQK
jgi:hypothetical protein